MDPQELLSPYLPGNCDYYVGLITSDYQVRVRWGYMGFDNASWDASCIPGLVYNPETKHWSPRVDVDHKRNQTLDGYMVGIKSGSSSPRMQADWTEPRPMDYVLAAFALPKGSCSQRTADLLMRHEKRVGISIEHGGRKPRRTIGPCVTITGNPWNRDCWMLYRFGELRGGFVSKFIYPKKLKGYGANGKKDIEYPICLPTGILLAAEELMDKVRLMTPEKDVCFK